MSLARFTTPTTLALVGCLLPLFVGPAAAEVDVAAALAGRWEGQVVIKGSQYPPARVLIIKNPRQESTGAGVAKWKADGSYGVTADKLGRVDLAITVVDPTVTVEFTTQNSLHATLKLVKPNLLEGTIVVPGGQETRMRLERRE